MQKRCAEVEITHYSPRGYGVGRADTCELPIEVPGGVVGERLRVALGKRRKGFFRAHLLEILRASADRVTPHCRHFLECGGCSLQQLSYPVQLANKEASVRRLFAPYLGAGSVFYPILRCKENWHYRNKMEFSFSQDREKRHFLGLNRRGSPGRVLDLRECHLVAPWYALLLQSVREWWGENDLEAYHPLRDTGTLRTLTLREGKRTGEKMVVLTVSGNRGDSLRSRHLRAWKEAVLRALPGENPSLFLRIHRARKGRPSRFDEMHLHGADVLRERIHLGNRTLHYHLSPASFFQPNTLQAEQLFLRALEISEPRLSDRVCDLYCGVGTFGALFSPFVEEVIGIEENPYAVCDARVAIANNALTNFSVIEGDVGTRLAMFRSQLDLAICDPPRVGIDGAVIAHLLRLAPKRILYVSCNPETQSRDIGALIENGYRLRVVQPIDQFPHTPHVENIAYLTR